MRTPPVVANGEFLTVAAMGIEKRMIYSSVIEETVGEYTDGRPCLWYNFRIYQEDGTYQEWADDKRRLIYDTKAEVDRIMARHNDYEPIDIQIQIGGHKFESRMLRHWKAHLDDENYPRLDLFMHQNRMLRINKLPLSELRNQLFGMLLRLHPGAIEKDIWNALNFNC